MFATNHVLLNRNQMLCLSIFPVSTAFPTAATASTIHICESQIGLTFIGIVFAWFASAAGLSVGGDVGVWVAGVRCGCVSDKVCE